ncbi:hypothetical protein N0V93_008160 [Gnomoniopsis smithogilvyi]|uniref:Uncharacterized protein n=1 Tax=Gnomoniopsis smithogilvyi TaxID=1191159 RepID=A0A9W8YPI1_9PEZI|nr:hypothetical protein N0V93_008160 [Gnomoniopsis smithogilvyi]
MSRKFIPMKKRRASRQGNLAAQNASPSTGLSSTNIGTTTAVNVYAAGETEDGAIIMTDPITAAIMLITAIIGLITGTISIMSAVIGFVQKPRRPSEDVGAAWTLWLSTGYDGAHNPDGTPLTGAAGPFPDVLIFGKTGDYIGCSHDETSYAQHGSWNGFPVWPLDKDHRQKPEYALLSFTRSGDPLCVVEFGLSKDADQAPSGHSGFNALTAQTCGYEWYHSGTTRTEEKGDDMPVPCFWFGEENTKSAQFHLPSHSMILDRNRIKKINTSAETRHEHFCNSPAKMNFWDDAPDKSSMKGRLNTALDLTGRITLNETLEKTKGKKNPGSLSARQIARRAIHQDTISIARKKRRGLLADELCSMGNSWGPDWVNEEEGQFCRMSDKTMWPVCAKEISDNCFDMGLKDLVIGGKVHRALPYSREVYYGGN